MATLDYAEIPPYATRLQPRPSSSNPNSISSLRPAPKILTSLPHPENHASVSASNAPPLSPTKGAFALIPQLLLSSTLQLPQGSSSPHPTSDTTRNGANSSSQHRQGKLLTNRDPLSIPITTANFRRFVAKTGPVFWLQDRMEEVIMWRKGWMWTGVWMAAYAFLCYFPRLLFLMPHAIALGVIVSTHPSLRASSKKSTSAPPAIAQEGSVDWQANIQAIQNLMGAVSDLDDFILPFLPHLTHGTPYTSIIFTFTVVSFLALLVVLPVLPLRPIALVLGLTPFVLTHPYVRTHALPILLPRLLRDRSLRTTLIRTVDDNNLEDRHWNSELREVELWENERWGGVEGKGGGWGKVHLRDGERSAWTRGRDGWSGVKEDGSGDVSNLTFSLSPGWAFVETEDWRPDIEAGWVDPFGSDYNGWVYTNDAWLDPRHAPVDAWKSSGMTRRRRWIRRIYYSPSN